MDRHKSGENKNYLSEKKISSQLNLLYSAGKSVLQGVFGRRMPPDLLLAEFFRSNRQCGSRDRAFISGCVYALLRYWGFLRRMMPAEWRRSVEHGEILFSKRELGVLFYVALFCDNPSAPELNNFSLIYGFPKINSRPPKSVVERAAAAAKILDMSCELTMEQLLPEWLHERIADAGSTAAALAKRPPLWIRIHRNLEACMTEFESKGLQCEMSERISGAAALFAPKINLFSLEGYAKGYFEVQDLASQAIGTVCGARPGERILDACAGAGGKTLQLASMMKNKGTIIAGDIRANKLDELRRRASRAELFNIRTRAHDGKLWRDVSPFDRVLLDVPCTGSGVWRRNPGMQWSFTPEKLESHVKVQKEILEHFCAAVKPGGTLIYSTCSLFAEENEMQINDFLEHHEEFVLKEGRNPLTGEFCSGCYRFNADDGNCDYMFAAVMEKSAR
ncbi:MAG: RsmB/NOP family class I SAM-dependent RNA methyltransferase [Lentisphaeria bacterium]|nr:RsmB/NOP family class I SAM-dependent RNA methyltransferase [Lentisphaeria bacterium]